MTTTEEIPTLLTPEEVREKLGLKTETNHTLRQLELRGQLHPIRLNSRTIRYDPRDVAKMIADGRAR